MNDHLEPTQKPLPAFFSIGDGTLPPVIENAAESVPDGLAVDIVESEGGEIG